MVKSRRTCICTLLAVFGISASASFTASATAKEATVADNCRLGAVADEHWTKARHISYDDNHECPRIRQHGIRRCWGQYHDHYTPQTTSNWVQRTWSNCDAVSTTTFGYSYGGAFLGSVQVTQ